MSIFQESVLESYLKSIDKKKINDAFEVFKKYYGNQERLQNIADSKEEQYQEGFLRDLFVHVFGYTINPDPSYNLTTEFKNLQDAKKADGAILKDGKPVAVIELKSNKTKNLESIQDQAFRYKNGQKDCRYVITSNFRLIRFYVDDATEYEEFNLFDIKEHEFELMYFLLNKENILSDVPFKLKSDSKFHEDNISNKLYKDYSVFREEIYQNIIQKNPTIDKLELYKKTQKLLDRFLFIFFAEDRGLIPPNSISNIIEQWHKLKEMDAYTPLYERFIKFFGYLNSGYESNGYVIHAYNGGLFKPDNILDEIIVDDEPLIKNCMTLSKYHFDSEVDVNILGHIFEHSLGDIEEKAAEISGEKVDKSRTRRKKDGVFYTPKFITKYIIENTIGSLCRNKKQEIRLYDFDLSKDYKKTKGKNKDLNEKGKQIKELLEDYKKWLFSLRILDPACGSGAFLNEALDYLIKEHALIDDMIAELTKDTVLRLTDTDKEILEQNLYGVDINDESVEIAKLSLWLRTAQKGRKLSDLNKNIKCGNSLIDDPAYAGEKAFNWHEEFKDIMNSGGFDVIIGNPPYIRIQGLKTNYENESLYYEQNFTSAVGKYDIYVLFIELVFKLLKTDGKCSYILPHKFFITDFGKGIRKLLVDRKFVEEVIHFGSHMVFEDASAYTCIIKLSKNNSRILFSKTAPDYINNLLSFSRIEYDTLSNKPWYFADGTEKVIIEKVTKQKNKYNDLFRGAFQGIVSGDNSAFYLYDCVVSGNNVIGFSKLVGDRVEIESDVTKPLVGAKNVNKYLIDYDNTRVIYTYRLNGDKTELIDEKTLKTEFPKCYSYLLSHKMRLENRGSEKMQYPCWYSLWNFRNSNNQSAVKIITPDVCYFPSMALDENGLFYHNDTTYGLILRNNDLNHYKSILSILNSSLFWYFITMTAPELRGGFFRFKTKYLENFSFPDLTEHYLQFQNKSEIMINNRKLIKTLSERFINLLTAEMKDIYLSGKLLEFYINDFNLFLSELKKQKINLSLKDKAEWMEYFDKCVLEIKTIQAEIDKIEKEIDQMVYHLYGLTSEEIEIVESSI